MSVRISIIIATFNSARYLRGCLDAIYAQSYSNFEVVVVDGGSTDGTVEIIQHFAIVHSLKWISEKDNGIYDAWNKGLKLSEGEWITFVGSDDVVRPDWLHSMMEKIVVDNSLTYVSGIVKLVDHDLTPIRDWGEKWSSIKNERYMGVAHVGSMHRRSLLQKYGVFCLKYKRVADYEFLLRAAEGIKAEFVNEVIADMRVGGGSDSIEAIKESFIVKKDNGYLPCHKNLLSFIWAVLTYYKRSLLKG